MHLNRRHRGIYIITQRARSQRAVLNIPCIVNRQFLQDKSTGNVVLFTYYSGLIKSIITRTGFVIRGENNINFVLLQHNWRHGGGPAFHCIQQICEGFGQSFFHNWLPSENVKNFTTPILCGTLQDARLSLPFSKPFLLPGHRLSIPSTLLTASTVVSFTQGSCFCHLPTILVVRFEKAWNKAELVSLHQPI